MFIPAPGVTAPEPKTGVYEFNPACICRWCENGGKNPTPGAPAMLGYDEPHFPPTRSPFKP